LFCFRKSYIYLFTGKVTSAVSNLKPAVAATLVSLACTASASGPAPVGLVAAIDKAGLAFRAGFMPIEGVWKMAYQREFCKGASVVVAKLRQKQRVTFELVNHAVLIRDAARPKA
jgi:hypothetical protein